jgi:hypothetical protein
MHIYSIVHFHFLVVFALLYSLLVFRLEFASIVLNDLGAWITP